MDKLFILLFVVFIFVLVYSVLALVLMLIWNFFFGTIFLLSFKTALGIIVIGAFIKGFLTK